MLFERVRNKTKSSPSSLTRRGLPPGSLKCAVGTTGSQYWRNRLPIGVAGPTRVKVSFSSRVKWCSSSRRTLNILSAFFAASDRCEFFLASTISAEIMILPDKQLAVRRGANNYDDRSCAAADPSDHGTRTGGRCLH